MHAPKTINAENETQKGFDKPPRALSSLRSTCRENKNPKQKGGSRRTENGKRFSVRNGQEKQQKGNILGCLPSLLPSSLPRQKKNEIKNRTSNGRSLIFKDPPRPTRNNRPVENKTKKTPTFSQRSPFQKMWIKQTVSQNERNKINIHFLLRYTGIPSVFFRSRRSTIPTERSPNNRVNFN